MLLLYPTQKVAMTRQHGLARCTAGNLTRFRADPSKVRISVRPHGALWYVKISSRSEERGCVERMNQNPLKALVLALRAADDVNLPGIDVGMDWAYEHPQAPR
jgi:hypothetical protein